jgi:hypothetical protein
MLSPPVALQAALFIPPFIAFAPNSSFSARNKSKNILSVLIHGVD